MGVSWSSPYVRLDNEDLDEDQVRKALNYSRRIRTGRKFLAMINVVITSTLAFLQSSGRMLTSMHKPDWCPTTGGFLLLQDVEYHPYLAVFLFLSTVFAFSLVVLNFCDRRHTCRPIGWALKMALVLGVPVLLFRFLQMVLSFCAMNFPAIALKIFAAVATSYSLFPSALDMFFEEDGENQRMSAPVKHTLDEPHNTLTTEAQSHHVKLFDDVRKKSEECGLDFKPCLPPICNAITDLTIQDKDQELKECSISGVGVFLSTFGDHIPRDELSTCLNVLVDHIEEERTQLAALQAFAVIAASPVGVDLSCVLGRVIMDLTRFLGKASPALRQASFGTLNRLITGYGDEIGGEEYEAIALKLPTLISASNLHMTALALELCCTLMSKQSSSSKIGLAVKERVLSRALNIVKNSLLQGQALMAFQKFFVALVDSAYSNFDTLRESLLPTAEPSPQSAKQAVPSRAQCMAALCLAGDDGKCLSTVSMLTNILNQNNDLNSGKQRLALLCLGEIGRTKDLSSQGQIQTLIFRSFESPLEEIKSVAAFSLGNFAVGNLPECLPFILDKIDNQKKHKYLLLHSLKEIIIRQSAYNTGFQESSVDNILHFLFNLSESEEEAIRDVVAECLGRIALIDPNRLVPALKERTTHKSAFTRATVITAAKHAIVKQQGSIDGILAPQISSFLMCIKDKDRHVRRAVFLAFSTVAHNKPGWLKDRLHALFPLLFEQTVFKENPTRIVGVFPFKHIVDDGVELRKAAFECVDTVFHSCPYQPGPSSFILEYLKFGLEDQYDVQVCCHLILSKFAKRWNDAVIDVLPELVYPIKEVIFRPKQGVDHDVDIVRSALRVVASLYRIGGRELSCRFEELMKEIEKSQTLWETFCSILNE